MKEHGTFLIKFFVPLTFVVVMLVGWEVSTKDERRQVQMDKSFAAKVKALREQDRVKAAAGKI